MVQRHHEEPKTRRTVKIDGMPVTLTPLGAALFKASAPDKAAPEVTPFPTSIEFPVWFNASSMPNTLHVTGVREPRCSEILYRQAQGVEALEEEVDAQRQLLQEIRTLLTARGYNVGDLPDFLIPMALASIVPERPKEEVSRD